jgi:Flp pilus assembly protein TadB
MDNNDIMLIGLLLAAAASVGAVIYIIVHPYLSGERRTDKRIQGVTENRGKRIALKTQVETTQNRRRQVAETLKDLEDRQKARVCNAPESRFRRGRFGSPASSAGSRLPARSTYRHPICRSWCRCLGYSWVHSASRAGSSRA